MKQHLRSFAIIVIALLLGGLASNWLGASPAAIQPVKPAVSDWDEGWKAEDGLPGAAAVWQEKAPWGAPPAAAAAAAEPPPPPPPVPVGVAKDGKRYTAIFQVNGDGVMRLQAGGRLPDGGKVLQVSGRRIVWLDAEGKRQQRDIFNDFQGGQ